LNPFRNASVLNEGSPILPKMVAMATSLEESEKEIWTDQ